MNATFPELRQRFKDIGFSPSEVMQLALITGALLIVHKTKEDRLLASTTMIDPAWLGRIVAECGAE